MTRWPCAVLTLLALANPIHAEPIKVVVPFAAGGPTDMIARLIGQDMQVTLKTDVVIENKGGAGVLERCARPPSPRRSPMAARAAQPTPGALRQSLRRTWPSGGRN